MSTDTIPAVAEAVAWISAQAEPIPHIIPALKSRFGLTGLQACQAIALARNADHPSHPDVTGSPSGGEGEP